MAIYRTVHLSFWTDSKVDDCFTPEDKYFYLYLLTNPHTNICGCYQISNKQFERETGYNMDTINRLLHRMERVHNVIRYDKDTKEILILNWGKYNWSKSNLTIKSVKSSAAYIKNDDFRSFILTSIERYGTETVSVNSKQKQRTETVSESVSVSDAYKGHTRGMQGAYKGHTRGMQGAYKGHTDTENVDNSVDKFVDNSDDGLDHPSLEELTDYCNENNLNLNPRTMYVYLNYMKWLDSTGKPISDWKGYLKACSANNDKNNTSAVG